MLEGSLACYMYKTEDADAGEFTYIRLAPDTPDTTFHIEFRYGDDPEALNEMTEGKYAYWMAAGMLVDADEEDDLQLHRSVRCRKQPQRRRITDRSHPG